MGRKRIGAGIKGRRGEGQGWGGWEGDWVEEARVEEGRRKVGRMGKETKILQEKKKCEMDKLLKKKLTTYMEQNFEYTSTMICYV